jgi:hypothetical protein
MDSLLQAQAREAAAYRRETGQLAIDEFERRAREARQRREEEKRRDRDREAAVKETAKPRSLVTAIYRDGLAA